MNKAKGELTFLANHLMRRGWNSSKLFRRSFKNKKDEELVTTLMKVFSQSAQDARSYISQETLKAYQKDQKSVA